VDSMANYYTALIVSTKVQFQTKASWWHDSNYYLYADQLGYDIQLWPHIWAPTFQSNILPLSIYPIVQAVCAPTHRSQPSRNWIFINVKTSYLINYCCVSGWAKWYYPDTRE
jgi:hypothetical protein